MNGAIILVAAAGVGLAAGGGVVAWERRHAPVAVEAGPNPIKRGLAGELECTMPDRKRKLCRGMAEYAGSAELGYVSKDSIYLGRSPDGDVTLKLTTPVHVKDGQLCGTLTRDIVMRGQVFVGARALPPEIAAEGLNHMTAKMTPILNKEHCGRFVEGPDGIIKVSNELAGGSGEVPMIWVRADEGYSVGM